MEKKTELINIYLKIHQKRDLSWEDLEYLARFDPECFEKTCRNVVYNLPQTKEIMLPREEKKEEKKAVVFFEEEKNNLQEKRLSISHIIENLKKMEIKQLPIAETSVERVKNLLGNLYMELQFPHNDKDTFWSSGMEEKGKGFDKKA